MYESSDVYNPLNLIMYNLGGHGHPKIWMRRKKASLSPWELGTAWEKTNDEIQYDLLSMSYLSCYQKGTASTHSTPPFRGEILVLSIIVLHSHSLTLPCSSDLIQKRESFC